MLRRELEHENLIQALNHMKATLLVCDRNRDIVYYNDYVCTTLALPPELLDEANLDTLCAEGYLRNSASLQAFETKELSIKYVQGKSKMQMPLLTVANPVLGPDGEVEMVVAVSFDDKICELVAHELMEARRNSMQLLDFLTNSNVAENVIAESSSMRRILDFLTRISSADSNLLLVGPTGTGKEVLAKFAHNRSMRSDRVFIPVNCAAIPENLMESEFFGYEKGTFTGGNKDGKAGILELADGGTIFLDEIGEMSLPLQAKFLRVIETGEVVRLGGAVSKKINVRLIAATNRNLEEMCDLGTFRRDLYYRLNILSVRIPPLKDRTEDIVPLAMYFLRKLNRKYGKAKVFSKEVLDWMEKYHWPGNVRELRNVVERLFVTSATELLMSGDSNDFNLNISSNPTHYRQKETCTPEQSLILEGETLHSALEGYEKQVITEVLAACNGNVSKAAERLGLHRSALYRKLEKYRR